MRSPFPGPDRPHTGGGWIWEPYGPERLLERTVAVFELALAGYQHVVSRWFTGLAPRMRTAVTLPAVLRARVHAPTDHSFAGGPSIRWYLDPLPDGSTSRVEMELSDEAGWTWDVGDEAWSRVRALRPHAAKWIDLVVHGGVLEVFNIYDARDLVYEWLWSDLQNVGWVPAGALGDQPYNDSLTIPW